MLASQLVSDAVRAACRMHGFAGMKATSMKHSYKRMSNSTLAAHEAV